MNWAEQRGNLEVAVLLAGGFYIAATYLLRSLNRTGKISWQGRRFRNSVTLFLVLFFGGLEVTSLHTETHIGFAVATLLYAVLGLLFLLLARWWWRDRKKEAAAREELIEKLHQEGRELIAPPMSAGKRVWRWTVNGYALFLVVAGLYVLVRYLVKH